MLRFGQYLHNKRQQAGLTVEVLAKRVGLSKSMISQVENGKNSISLESLFDLKKILPSIKLGDILDEQFPVVCSRCKGKGYLRS